MTTLRFEPSGFETDVPEGTRVIDVTDEHAEADVPYSCRSASCGTCRVEVLEGMDRLAAPEEDELGVLDLFGSPEGVRLACQLRVVRPDGRVVLRVVGD